MIFFITMSGFYLKCLEIECNMRYLLYTYANHDSYIPTGDTVKQNEILCSALSLLYSLTNMTD